MITNQSLKIPKTARISRRGLSKTARISRRSNRYYKRRNLTTV